MDGKDNTFCFGFLRDLLRLRNSLRISAGVIVFGSDASSLATEKDARSVVDLCRELGILVIEEPQLPVLAIVATHADRFSDIVTDDRRILCFCTDRRAIHLGKEPRSIERMTPGWVQRSLGVPVQHVPTYLALTEGRKHGLASSDGAQPTLTTRDARRLVELHGALPGIYQHLSTMKSHALRKKLADNQKAFEERYSDNTPSPPEASAGLPSSLAWNLDGKEGETHGLISVPSPAPRSLPEIRSSEARLLIKKEPTFLDAQRCQNHGPVRLLVPLLEFNGYLAQFE